MTGAADTAGAKQWLTALIGSAPFGTLAFDLQGYCTLANRQAGDVFGCRPRDLVDQHLLEVFADWPALFTELAERSDERTEFDLDEQPCRGRTYRVRGIRMLEGMLVILDDVTSRSEAQRAQRRLVNRLEAANRELRQFADIAAHDLKAPIRNLLGLLAQLDDDVDANERDALLTMLGSAVHQLDERSRALGLILAHQHPVTEARPKSDLVVALRAAEGRLELADHDVTAVHLELAPEASTCVPLPAPQLETVLQNLLENAFKFSVTGRSPRIDITLTRQQGRCCLAVSDNGSGIDVDRHGKQAFELFRRLNTDRPGIGVGLYVVHSIVAGNGGEIRIESEPGNGARFVMEFEDDC